MKNLLNRFRINLLWIVPIAFGTTSCYTVHKDVGVIYSNAYLEAKEKLDINKGARVSKVFNDNRKPVVMVRTDANQSSLSETELTNRYVEFLWVEASLLERGYTVKDRVLVDNISAGGRKKDYSEIHAKTGVDVIIDIGSAEVKNYATHDYFNKRLNSQRTLNSSIDQKITIPVYTVFGKVTDVKTGQFMGDFNLLTNGIAIKNMEKVEFDVLTRKSRGIIDHRIVGGTSVTKPHRIIFLFPIYLPFCFFMDLCAAGGGMGLPIADALFGSYRTKGTDYMYDKDEFLLDSNRKEAMQYTANKILTEF